VRRPLLVAEDISARTMLFRVFGVTWFATRYAWVSPLSWAALGLAMGFAAERNSGAADVLIAGLGYGAALYATNILHSVGHIIAGRVVGTPAGAILVTSTRDITIYTLPGAAAPPRCRLGRALGGPAANLAVGCALILAGHLAEAPWVTMTGIVNVCVAVWTLMPVPSLDGSVIWSVLFRSRGDAAP